MRKGKNVSTAVNLETPLSDILQSSSTVKSSRVLRSATKHIDLSSGVGKRKKKVVFKGSSKHERSILKRNKAKENTREKRRRQLEGDSYGSKKRQRNEKEDYKGLVDSDGDPSNMEERREANYLSLRIRTSPKQFVRVLHLLTSKQIAAIKNLGFGRLLELRMNGIPGKLAHFVVDKFNQNSMELDVGWRKIKVDREVVHKFLGIPNSGIDFKSMGVKKKNLSGIAGRWKNLYRKVGPSAKDIVDRIQAVNDDDIEVFEIDFVVLFIITLIDCHKTGKPKADLMNVICEDFDVKNINWCDFVLDKLKHCKDGWNRDQEREHFFRGPVVLLTLLYVESFECPHVVRPPHESPLKFWTYDLLQTWQNYEIRNGGFGLGSKADLEEEGTPHTVDDLLVKREIVKRKLGLLLVEKKALEKDFEDLMKMDEAGPELTSLISHYSRVMADIPHWATKTSKDMATKLSTSRTRSVLDDFKTGDTSGWGGKDNRLWILSNLVK